MKVRKRILPGILAAVIFCGSLFDVGLVKEGPASVYAAENVALGKPVEASAQDPETPNIF